MKKVAVVSGIIIAVCGYFIMTLLIFPQEYLLHQVINPQPIHTVKLSDDKITIGKSFDIDIVTENKNDFADILITSVAFPNLQNIGNETKITSYNFTQSPAYIKIGEKLNSGYTRGEMITSEYPSIEAYSRNSPPDSSYSISLRISPPFAGSFDIYIKTIAIPHSTDLSHYPHDGFLDPQQELVEVYNVMVNP
ncbi:MAG: hypothetical protein ACT4N5_05075 [Nitrosopumilaceae archaeon]